MLLPGFPCLVYLSEDFENLVSHGHRGRIKCTKRPRYQHLEGKLCLNSQILWLSAHNTDKNQYDQIVVRLTRRAHNAELRPAGNVGSQGPISWTHKRNLILEHIQALFHRMLELH